MTVDRFKEACVVRKAVWKFTFSVTDEIVIDMQAGAEIVHVGVQHDVPCVWALVDPAAPAVRRTFALFGTGHPVAGGLVHRGSFQTPPFVWHLFEAES